MAKVDTYECDVCGSRKGDTNHWFSMFRVPGPRVTIVPFGLPKREEAALEFHLCGIGCVTKQLAVLLADREEAETQAVLADARAQHVAALASLAAASPKDNAGDAIQKEDCDTAQ